MTVVRTGSFSRAAAEECCTQSAVTRMMNAFEAELGCKVLERNHAGVRLTPAGEKLLPSIAEADASLRRLAEQAQGLHAQGANAS
ncbi:MAG: LysR family transcriptional regulator [Eggerthellaceae bacterium]